MTIRQAKSRVVAILFGLALLAALPAGCAANDDLTLANAQAFDAYRLYYSGPEVAGLPLEAIAQGWSTNGHARQQGRRRINWTFIYGDCTPPPTEGGCAPPLQVFTGRTTIVIFGNEKPLIKTAARELREVHRAQAASRLPSPARGSLKERLRCQRKRADTGQRRGYVVDLGFAGQVPIVGVDVGNTDAPQHRRARLLEVELDRLGLGPTKKSRLGRSPAAQPALKDWLEHVDRLAQSPQNQLSHETI